MMLSACADMCANIACYKAIVAYGLGPALRATTYCMLLTEMVGDVPAASSK